MTSVTFASTLMWGLMICAAIQVAAMIVQQPSRIRHSRGLMLVCIAGVLGAWNFLSISPTTTLPVFAQTLYHNEPLEELVAETSGLGENATSNELVAEIIDSGENKTQSTTSESLLSTIKSIRSTIDKVTTTTTRLFITKLRWLMTAFNQYFQSLDSLHTSWNW